jgi:hypothetical protein
MDRPPIVWGSPSPSTDVEKQMTKLKSLTPVTR